MNTGLLGIPGGASGNSGRALRVGPFPVVPGSSVVFSNPFGRATIMAVIYECVKADLNWRVGDLVQEWIATVSSNGHGVTWGRYKCVLSWGTNVRLVDRLTAAQSAIASGSWLAWVVLIG